MDQADQIPAQGHINTRCTSLEKQCQYTASRRGGLDRAALSERRKRLATGTDSRLSAATPHLSLGVSDDVTISNRDVQHMIGIDGIGDVLCVETPHTHIENLAEDPLIKSYYTNFHDFHPFVLPLRHLNRLREGLQEASLDFEPLIAVMCLIGHLYSTHQWSDSLKSRAETCIAQLSSLGPVQVQSRLLYSIALFWNNLKIEAKKEIDTAADIATELGMHKQEFAATHGAGDDVLMESWRRTWWMLFIVDAYYAGTLGTMNLKTFNIEATVELPCEESEYESANIPVPRTLEDFDSREFSDEEIIFSSFAYLIGAVQCAALAISASPKKATRQDSEYIIQSADSIIDAWLLLLPKAQKPVLQKDGTIDELMFQAHLLVHVVTIGLHRPLSDLRFNPIESVSSCAREPPPDTPKPDLINVHTARILKSVNAQIQLLALPVRPFKHTPFTTCMVSDGTLALLSACNYLLQGKALAIARDQIRLTIGCLKALGEIWPRTAKNVKEIQTIARHVLKLKGGSTTTSITPTSSELPSLTGSEGETSIQSADSLEQGGDILASLGSFEDVCGWMNMGIELNVNDWMDGSMA
ncbi:hypothetical protein FSARC_7133 [Fusarium sarcochroum]|uniref:Xylanolytic transcriptional activator regulatory domain-containing protein n=1 Tax=Fusarium sarcochroum TaxID=1208366 RepID=A0A8H4X8K4_9HYPO|nr:hypothetical protein FSARC_7133 [Fusarium sarcochroum]